MLRILILLSAGLTIGAGKVEAQVNIEDPQTARDYYARGEHREKAKRYKEALADYRKAGELDPQHFDAHFSRASLHAELKDYSAAIADLAASLAARPDAYSALFNRGLYHQYLRKYDHAIADYSRALAEDADFSFVGHSPNECRAHAHHYRGRVYQWFKNDNAKAIVDYTAALRLDPTIEMVHYRRGQAYHGVGDYAKAHADYEQAVKKDPDYPNLLNSWAWQLATCPDSRYRDGDLALRLARKTRHLETLAAAYAETGEFEEAVTTQKRALDQLERRPEPKTEKGAKDRKKLKAKMQARLDTYKAGRAYREK